MQWRRPPINILGTAALALALMGFMFLEKTLAPKADLWPYWQAFDAESTMVIDHGPWDRFLKTYIRKGPDGVNRVLYGRVDKAARKGPGRYLGSEVGPRQAPRPRRTTGLLDQSL